MKVTKFVLRRTVVAGMLLCAASSNVLADENIPYSEAETKIFMTDQLSSLPAPSTLKYRFVRQGTLEKGFDDTVAMTVDAPDKGKTGRPVHVNFLTGDRKLELPDISEATGNPVTMFFLERDVREMHRITKGSRNYYQKRIRMALEDKATVKPVTIQYGGQSLAASEIRIEPYRDDPARSRFAQYANKIYLMTFSDKVPGGVYQLKTIMSPPDSPTGSKPMIEETLTLLEEGK
jgi:hypothetical protein